MMTMTQETLLCGRELVSPAKGIKGKSEIRKQGLPLVVEFRGTYRQCKAYARKNRLLMSQAPSARAD